jgi:hypothetical protein
VPEKQHDYILVLPAGQEITGFPQINARPILCQRVGLAVESIQYKHIKKPADNFVASRFVSSFALCNAIA